MKKYSNKILIIIGMLLIGISVHATSLFQPYQGGTGIGSATAGQIGKVLTVSNNSPLTYSLTSIPSQVYPSSTGIVTYNGSAWGTSISGTSSQFVKGDGSLDSNTYLQSAGTMAGTYNTVTVGTSGLVTSGSNTAYLTGVTASAPLSGSGTVGSPLIFTNPGYITSSALSGYLQNNVGIAGGTTLIGGTAASENLTLSSTSNATKGKILFGTSAYDEVNNRLGILTTSPTYQLENAGGTAATSAIRSWSGYDIYPVPPPSSGYSGVLHAGTELGIGDYYYAITYTTALGETTALSNVKVTTAANNQEVTLTIPVSTDPRVTGRKLYRTKVNGSSFTIL